MARSQPGRKRAQGLRYSDWVVIRSQLLFFLWLGGGGDGGCTSKMGWSEKLLPGLNCSHHQPRQIGWRSTPIFLAETQISRPVPDTHLYALQIACSVFLSGVGSAQDLSLLSKRKHILIEWNIISSRRRVWAEWRKKRILAVVSQQYLWHHPSGCQAHSGQLSKK